MFEPEEQGGENVLRPKPPMFELSSEHHVDLPRSDSKTAELQAKFQPEALPKTDNAPLPLGETNPLPSQVSISFITSPLITQTTSAAPLNKSLEESKVAELH